MWEEDKKRVNVQMTLEEASDLYERSWEPINQVDGYTRLSNRFEMGDYGFYTQNLSELIKYVTSLSEEDREHMPNYSSGRTYLARKRGKNCNYPINPSR